MRTRLWTLVLTMLAVLPLSLKAQVHHAITSGDTTAIMTATAAYVQKLLSLHSPLVEVDDGSVHASARGMAVAQALNIRAGKAAPQCTGSSRSSCHLVGTQASMRLMAPLAHGDTAVVRVQVIQETTNQQQPLHSSVLAVTLVRRGVKWVAIRDRLAAIS